MGDEEIGDGDLGDWRWGLEMWIKFLASADLIPAAVERD